jgi:hypothetical protein
MKLVELLVWSDSSRFSRKENRDNTMVTEGHRHAGKKSKVERRAWMDREIAAWMILGDKFRSWANFPWFFQKRDSLF